MLFHMNHYWTCIKTKPNQTKSVISLYFCMEKAQTCTCCCCCFVVLRATLHITLHNRDILKKENCRYRWFMVLWKMSVLWNQCLSQKLKERQDCFSKNGHKSHKVFSICIPTRHIKIHPKDTSIQNWYCVRMYHSLYSCFWVTIGFSSSSRALLPQPQLHLGPF